MPPCPYPLPMNLSLSGKRALVCGASQGIGRACALELARAGAAVTALARDASKLGAVVQALPDVVGGPGHDLIAVDLASPEAVRAAFAHHLRISPAPYHVLVCNTGGPPAGTALDATTDQLLAAFTAQLLSAHVLVQAMVPGFRSAGYGRIITITSTSVKSPIPNLGISNIVRPAVAAWCKCLATELGPHGVTANNVLPGYTATDRLASIIRTRAGRASVSEDAVKAEIIAATPLGRFAEPEEIAAVVAFLASPAAGYVSGINVPVDGGRLGTL